MLHFWSGDLTSGTSFNGTFSFQNVLKQGQRLIYSFIDDQAIPWLYSGANSLVVALADDGAASQIGPFTINFGQLATERDDAATLAALKLDINTALGLALSPVTVDTLIHNDTTREFEMTLLPPASVMTWDWGDVGTTVKKMFGFPFATTNTLLNWASKHADPRPPVMEVDIDIASTIINATRTTAATLVVALSDLHDLDQNTWVPNSTHLSTNIAWCRCTAPGVPVPMNNDWHLKFVGA